MQSAHYFKAKSDELFWEMADQASVQVEIISWIFSSRGKPGPIYSFFFKTSGRDILPLRVFFK